MTIPCPICRETNVEVPAWDFADTTIEVPVCDDHGATISINIKASAIAGA